MSLYSLRLILVIWEAVRLVAAPVLARSESLYLCCGYERRPINRIQPDNTYGMRAHPLVHNVTRSKSNYLYTGLSSCSQSHVDLLNIYQFPPFTDLNFPFRFRLFRNRIADRWITRMNKRDFSPVGSKWSPGSIVCPVKPSASLPGFFFFSPEQETTCLKSSTWPQPVCFAFGGVRSSFSQQTCHRASARQSSQTASVRASRCITLTL